MTRTPRNVTPPGRRVGAAVIALASLLKLVPWWHLPSLATPAA
jgi:hypothetical protein